MSLESYNKQKSLQRRFLLILGITTLVCVLALGLMLMFNLLNLDLSPAERYGFGGLMIIYGILRFTRIFKKEPDE